MQNKKRFSALISMIIIVLIFGLLTYYAYFENNLILNNWSQLISATWIFIMIITIALAATYPKKQRTIKTKNHEKENTEQLPFFDTIETKEESTIPQNIDEKQTYETTINNMATNKEFIKKLASEIIEQLKTLEKKQPVENWLDELRNHVNEINIDKDKTFNKKIDNIIEPENNQETSIRQTVYKYLDQNPNATKEEIIKKFNLKDITVASYMSRWKKKQRRFTTV